MTTWRKATRSADIDCVEVRPVRGGVAVRDSKLPDGGVLLVEAVTWTALTRALKDLSGLR